MTTQITQNMTTFKRHKTQTNTAAGSKNKITLPSHYSARRDALVGSVSQRGVVS